MRDLKRTSQFKRDVRRMQRRGKDFSTFKLAIEALVHGHELASSYRDHALVGQYRGTRECHLEPDWLLIYEATPDELVLIRTGTHADLFE